MNNSIKYINRLVSTFRIYFICLFCGFLNLSNLFPQVIDTSFLAKQFEYTSLDEVKYVNPDEVYKLNLRKKKLKSIPSEIFTFSNLRVLNLSKNRISEIPDELGKLTKLEELDLSTNKLTFLPPVIFTLAELRKLILNKNDIETLPAAIAKLTKLEKLDLWGTQIIELPKEISKLNFTLKVLDLRVIYMTNAQQDRIYKLLPDVEILFSKSCNCD